jgi:hypothetical protein
MEQPDAKPLSQDGSQSRQLTAVSRWHAVFITIVILGVLYPLSLGPLYYFVIRGDIPFLPISLLSKIYNPLLRYASSDLPMAESYGNYLIWWCELGNESVS